MKSRTSRSRRRFRRGKREYIWVTGLRSDTLQTDGVADQLPLVTRIDWARDATATGHLEKGCLVRRTLIWGMVAQAGLEEGSGASTAVFAAVRKKDEDDVAVLDLGVDMLDEDWYQSEWLHTYHESSVVATLTWMADAASFQRFAWDTSVARKLTTEDQIEMSVAATGGGPTVVIAMQYGWRILLELP